MRKKWEKSEKIALSVSAGVGGGVTGAVAAFAATTDLSPVLTGLLAGSRSALLGTIALLITLRVVGKKF
jgi:hypothetical protein